MSRKVEDSKTIERPRGPRKKKPELKIARPVETGNGAGLPAKKRLGQRKQALAAEIAGEIQSLRPLLQEITGQFTLRLNAQIAELAEIFNGQPVSGEKPQLPPAKVQTVILDLIRALHCKPRKGRLKDLTRIEELLESVRRQIPPQP